MSPHECESRYLDEPLYTFWSERSYSGSSSLVIRRCRICGRLWKIRYQTDYSTGSDHIWLAPGTSARGYKFTEQEAASYA